MIQSKNCKKQNVEGVPLIATHINSTAAVPPHFNLPGLCFHALDNASRLLVMHGTTF